MRVLFIGVPKEYTIFMQKKYILRNQFKCACMHVNKLEFYLNVVELII